MGAVKLDTFKDPILDRQIEELVYYTNHLILVSPNGTKYMIKVANDGTLSSTAV